MKTISAAYDKIVYSRALLKWGLFLTVMTLFAVNKCTYAGHE